MVNPREALRCGISAKDVDSRAIASKLLGLTQDKQDGQDMQDKTRQRSVKTSFSFC
jgi:hypothetical protein